MVEIERKFLVKNTSYKNVAISHTRIVQGFLSSLPERTVRVRIKGELGFITIKGKSNASGTTRFEWEKEISLHEAEALLTLCEPGRISKVRYEIPQGDVVFEVDEFAGENDGLVIAEVELPSEDTPFEKPEWLGVEVTGEVKYYNSQLSKKPYSSW